MSNEPNSRPLFALGEEVVTQSHHAKDVSLTGWTCRISGVFTYGQATEYMGHIPGYSDRMYYSLEGFDPRVPLVGEMFLRKKYPPSSLGYEELICALKQDTLESVNF